MPADEPPIDSPDDEDDYDADMDYEEPGFGLPERTDEPPFNSGSDSVAPYYAPSCRQRPHWLIEHHERFAAVVGRECDCPCHRVNFTSPWWSDSKRGSRRA